MGSRSGKLGGRKTIPGGSGWVQICRVTDAHGGDPVSGEGGETLSKKHTIFSSIVHFQGPGGANAVKTPRVLLKIVVSDGNALGAGETEFIVIAGAPFTVSGSTIYVHAQLVGDDLGTVQLPPTIGNVDVFAVVEVFVTDEDGQCIIPTSFVPSPVPLVAGAQVVTGPRRIKNVRGYNSIGNANADLLMFFDWPIPGAANTLPPNGTTPLWTIPPVPTGAGFSEDFITSTRFVMYGLAWVPSTTDGTLTTDVTGFFRVDVELYNDARSPGQLEG